MGTSLQQIVESQRISFQKVAIDSNVNFEREAGFALQILNSNSYLGGIAINNQNSLIAAVNNVAAIGISLNPASKLAYLVPRKGTVCLDISYMGLLHLAQITGAIEWGQAAIVRANDVFELNGVDKQPTHKYRPFDDITQRGDVVGCYVVVKTDSGDFLTSTMTAAQVNGIRDRSEAYKAFLSKKTPCPWTTDYEEMAKKTVVKQAAKYWPRRERVDTAIHHMNTDGGEGVVIESGMSTEDVQLHIDTMSKAMTRDALMTAYTAAVKDAKDARDVKAAETFKASAGNIGKKIAEDAAVAAAKPINEEVEA